MGRVDFPGIGTWKLVSYQSRVDEGSPTYPLGHDAVGQIIYDRAGNLSAQIANTHRPSLPSTDLRRLTPEETHPAFKGYVAYFGTYDVDEKKGIVIHHLTNSLLPNWTGIDLVRHYEFSGNLMTLRSPPMLFGARKIVLTLVWEKV